MAQFTAPMLYELAHDQVVPLIAQRPLPDPNVLADMLREAATLMGDRTFPSLAEAWNHVTNGTRDQPGYLRFWTTTTCPRCHGHQPHDHHLPGCCQCAGRGVALQRVTVHTRWASPAAQTVGVAA